MDKERKTKDHHTIWITVFMVVGIGIMIWGVWFSAGAKELQDLKTQKSYTLIRNNIQKAFALFSEQKKTIANDEIDVDDLRARVFGDSVQK